MINWRYIAGIFMALLLVVSAIGHFFVPETYNGFIPDYLPKFWVNMLAGIVELALGIGFFVKKYRKIALQGTFLLMILLLPLHIIDLFREQPVIGSQAVAILRVPIQLVFIFLPWYAQKEG